MVLETRAFTLFGIKMWFEDNRKCRVIDVIIIIKACQLFPYNMWSCLQFFQVSLSEEYSTKVGMCMIASVCGMADSGRCYPTKQFMR